MTGPRRIVVLDEVPRHEWRIDDRSVVVWRRKLWTVESADRCVVCIEKVGPDYMTLSTADEDGHRSYFCMEHGELTALRFAVTKVFFLAGVVRQEEVVDSEMFFPSEMTLPERDALIERILDEAQRGDGARAT